MRQKTIRKKKNKKYEVRGEEKEKIGRKEI
jgi:hypothetical protein